jgi:GTP-binding protein HflX
MPRIALVGYTNAGKSTLFNALTGADAYTADKLFATLDPTVRRIGLPGGHAVLADTVGFVRDLPHELVAAFRSTLSEAREADLLLQVVDAADPLRDERIGQVDAVLAEIGAGDIPQLLVYNKIDRLDDSDGQGAQPRHDLPGGGIEHGLRERVWISARDGRGLDLVRDALGARLGLHRIRSELRLPPQAGRLRARLHELGAVLGEDHDEHGWRLDLDLAQADALRIASQPWGEPLQALLVDRPDADG